MTTIDRSNWEVHFNIFLKHIAHDITKGLYSQKYKWHNVEAETNDTGDIISFYQGKKAYHVGFTQLGTESRNYNNNSLKNYLTVSGVKSKMSQVTKTSNIAKNLNSQETKKMDNTTKNELASLAQTVGAQFKDAGVISLKTKSGEALLKAVENLILEKAGFIGRVKFRFMPEALDLLVAGGVSVLVAEYAGENHAAVIGAEALRLAAMRRVTDLLPITEIVDTLTKGGASLESINKLNN